MYCYIYYQAKIENQDQILGQVSRLQAALKRDHPLIAGLQRRPEEQQGLHTWMEIYRHIPRNFETLLTTAIQETKLLSLIEGSRHLEYFMEIIPCA